MIQFNIENDPPDQSLIDEEIRRIESLVDPMARLVFRKIVALIALVNVWFVVVMIGYLGNYYVVSDYFNAAVLSGSIVLSINIYSLVRRIGKMNDQTLVLSPVDTDLHNKLLKILRHNKIAREYMYKVNKQQRLLLKSEMKMLAKLLPQYEMRKAR